MRSVATTEGSARSGRACCGMREVTSGAAAGAFGDGTAGEDMETAEAAERLRTGRWGYRSCKRAFDIVFSLVVLVFLSWLYLIIAIAIKLDDPKGPVIFAQTRVGKDGREFRMYKFRSMVADAETRLAQLLERNEKTGPVFKMAHDPRVTRVGRILRKVSLDELPQFVNVFQGRPLRRRPKAGSAEGGRRVHRARPPAPARESGPHLLLADEARPGLHHLRRVGRAGSALHTKMLRLDGYQADCPDRGVRADGTGELIMNQSMTTGA